MRIMSGENVFDAALNRIRWLYDEFENIIVNFSGGKDSTIVLNLTLIVARERDRLPVKVMFIDQEAEWQAAIDYIRSIMSRVDVEPHWLQMPIKISNSTSDKSDWLMCWEEGAEWMREQEPNAITKNTLGTMRFKEVFNAYLEQLFPNENACYIGGVRGEESPNRMTGLTHYATWKWATWGRMMNKRLGHVSMYPIYDWSYTDVWKAIHDHGWDYCKVYDWMYQYGVKIPGMRVSNLHHETAIGVLFYLQEVEPDTWSRLTKRLGGISTAGHMKSEAFEVDELPHAFKNWIEYRDYLVEHLIEGEEKRSIYRAKFAQLDKFFDRLRDPIPLHKVMVKTVLVGDWEFTKLHNLQHTPKYSTYRRIKRGISVRPMWARKFGEVYL